VTTQKDDERRIWETMENEDGENEDGENEDGENEDGENEDGENEDGENEEGESLAHLDCILLRRDRDDPLNVGTDFRRYASIPLCFGTLKIKPNSFDLPLDHLGIRATTTLTS
jgi:hypothetical protein